MRKLRFHLLTLLFLLIPALSVLSYGQQDTLDKFDIDGKKDGTWIEYLNDKWEIVKNENTAVYFRYTYYDHGTNVYPMENFKKGYKLEFGSNNEPQKTTMNILNGEYKWVDGKGHTVVIRYFNQGHLVWSKRFYPSGNLHEFYDYQKKYKGQPHTYYLELYDKGGKARSFYMRPGPKGWCGYYEE